MKSLSEHFARYFISHSTRVFRYELIGITNSLISFYKSYKRLRHSPVSANFLEEILIAGDEPIAPRRRSHQNLKNDICMRRDKGDCSWATRGGSKATINVTSASRGGLELFYARGGGSRRSPLPLLPNQPPSGGEGTLSVRALRRIRATAPRTAARLHNRYPAYTCVSPHRAHTCVRGEEGKKKSEARVRSKEITRYIRAAGIFVSYGGLSKNQTDSLDIRTDINGRIVNMQGYFKIDRQTLVYICSRAKVLRCYVVFRCSVSLSYMCVF